MRCRAQWCEAGRRLKAEGIVAHGDRPITSDLQTRASKKRFAEQGFFQAFLYW
jgi:hypothetical protein